MSRTTRDGELIRTARTVLRLQRQIAKYRRAIKKAQADLKYERRLLRGLAYAAENGVQSIPSRLTGGATGYALATAVPPLDARAVGDLDLLTASTKSRSTDTTPVEDITVGLEPVHKGAND